MTIHMVENFHANREETYMRPPLQLQIFFGILFFVVETLGNFLLLCLMIYEKYGMDAQKRTATNQLLSGLCCSVIFFNVGILPLIMTVNIFEPQSESNIFKNFFKLFKLVCRKLICTKTFSLLLQLLFCMINMQIYRFKFFFVPFLDVTLVFLTFHGALAFLLFWYFIITEMAVLKALYLYKFSIISSMNEYFISTAIILFNIAILFLFLCTTLISEVYKGTAFYKLHTGEHIERPYPHGNFMM